MYRRRQTEFLVSGLTMGTWMLLDDKRTEKRRKTEAQGHEDASPDLQPAQKNLTPPVH